ncbi:hypothetical protein MSPP1_000346 [Malassezia sp. CBS 17886]|nr:hypothetical protein MSPP1_000346 [Malassezia sp. CBS 17886]
MEQAQAPLGPTVRQESSATVTKGYSAVSFVPTDQLQTSVSDFGDHIVIDTIIPPSRYLPPTLSVAKVAGQIQSDLLREFDRLGLRDGSQVAAIAHPRSVDAEAERFTRTPSGTLIDPALGPHAGPDNARRAAMGIRSLRGEPLLTYFPDPAAAEPVLLGGNATTCPCVCCRSGCEGADPQTARLPILPRALARDPAAELSADEVPAVPLPPRDAPVPVPKAAEVAATTALPVPSRDTAQRYVPRPRPVDVAPRAPAVAVVDTAQRRAEAPSTRSTVLSHSAGAAHARRRSAEVVPGAGALGAPFMESNQAKRSVIKLLRPNRAKRPLATHRSLGDLKSATSASPPPPVPKGPAAPTVRATNAASGLSAARVHRAAAPLQSAVPPSAAHPMQQPAPRTPRRARAPQAAVPQATDAMRALTLRNAPETAPAPRLERGMSVFAPLQLTSDLDHMLALGGTSDLPYTQALGAGLPELSPSLAAHRTPPLSSPSSVASSRFDANREVDASPSSTYSADAGQTPIAARFARTPQRQRVRSASAGSSREHIISTPPPVPALPDHIPGDAEQAPAKTAKRGSQRSARSAADSIAFSLDGDKALGPGTLFPSPALPPGETPGVTRIRVISRGSPLLQGAQLPRH